MTIHLIPHIMIHVGMNIQDKIGLFKKAHRVIEGGGYFGIYDGILTGDSNLNYPLPWADITANSFVSSPDDYKESLSQAGFDVKAERNRREFALDFFVEMMKKRQILKVHLHLVYNY